MQNDKLQKKKVMNPYSDFVKITLKRIQQLKSKSIQTWKRLEYDLKSLLFKEN